MALPSLARRTSSTTTAARGVSLALGLAAALAGARGAGAQLNAQGATPPSPDPRVGLRAGQMDAGEAAWNMRLVSKTPPPEKFRGSTNSDLAFTGKYAIQGSYNGFQVWDISNPASPVLTTEYYCPASQSDVSVYRNLLFVSGEGNSGRLDCGDKGVRDTVSTERLRGIRIFDISDVKAPKYVGNVQTCRGSHTHTVLEDPRDKQNVYIYVSGSANVRSPSELPGCVRVAPDKDPNSALFRIEGRLARAARQRREGPRRHRGPHRRRQRRAARRAAGDDRQDVRRGRRHARAPAPRPDAVPRHHGLPGHRAGRRRVRGLRAAPRHPQPGEPHARRGRGRLQLLVLALGDVQ
jgi:hypothetical protein